MRSLAIGLGTLNVSRWSIKVCGRADASQVFQMLSGTSLRSTPTQAPHRRSAPATWNLPVRVSTTLPTAVDNAERLGLNLGLLEPGEVRRPGPAAPGVRRT